MHFSMNFYICFIEYNKAFGKIRHNRLLEIFRKKNLEYRDIGLISNINYE